MAKIFADAAHHHQAGRLAEAEQRYRQVLVLDPRHADSLHLLGVIACQTGRPEAAIEPIRKAIAINAKVAPYHANLGYALRELARWEEAIACTRRVVELAPNDPDGHYNLGYALRCHGRPDEAVVALRRAIALRPNTAEMHWNLGVALRALGRLDEAVAALRQAVALRPDDAEGHFHLGDALRQQGLLEEAAACYRRAVEIAPNTLHAVSNLGGVLQAQGRPAEAEAAFRKAIALKPDHAEAYSNLGAALREQGRLDEAAACCRHAVVLKPDYASAHSNLGVVLHDLGRLDEAAASLRMAVALGPDDAEIHNNLGVTLQGQGLLDQAVACCRRAIQLRPDYPDAHGNLAMALLAQGNLAEGWEENEWRWRTAHLAKARRDLPRPQWRGEAAEGKTLLVHAEQGLGDTLQFCRFAPLAASRGLRVILEVRKPLVRLLRSLPGVDVVVEQGAALPDFDLHCPMLSLPLALGTTLATLPGAVPYLHADADQAAAWAARLSTLSGRRPRIGLVWAGSPRSHLPIFAATDRRRSVAPQRLAPLFDMAGADFFSLQKDGPAAPADFPLTDFMGEMDDFADTAAFIAHLDLVISVDTAVAHLAGALGKPVWLLNRFDSCWRWLRDRDDSPWYPSLRLFRQPQPGNWEAMIEQVAAELYRAAP